MPTKPATLPRPWGTNAVYLLGPFAGSPGKVDPGVGVAAEGHHPGSALPTAAEHENYQQRWLTAWTVDWLSQGSSSGAANAHIVETASTGRTTLVGLTLNDALDEVVLAVTGANTTANPAVRVTSSATCYEAAVADTGVGYYAPILSASSGVGFLSTMTSTASGARAFAVTANSGTAGTCIELDHAGHGSCIDAAHTGAGTCVTISATGAGTALSVNGGSSATTGTLLQGGTTSTLTVTSTVAGAVGVTVTGGSTAGTTALRAIANNNTGKAIVAEVPNTATSSARGVYSSVAGAATGAEFVATGSGNAMSLTGNATSAPLRVTGTAWPSDTFAGQLAFHAASGLWGISDPNDTAYRGVHASLGGYCYGLATGGTAADNAGLWVVAQTITLTDGDAPRVAGRRVNVKIKFQARSQGGTAVTVSYRVRDATAGTTLYTRDGAGALSSAGMRLSAIGQDWQMTVAMDYTYTIPSAGTRTFVLEVRRSGAAEGIAVRDASLEVTGEF